jgi:hypothetical protein
VCAVAQAVRAGALSGVIAAEAVFLSSVVGQSSCRLQALLGEQCGAWRCATGPCFMLAPCWLYATCYVQHKHSSQLSVGAVSVHRWLACRVPQMAVAARTWTTLNVPPAPTATAHQLPPWIAGVPSTVTSQALWVMCEHSFSLQRAHCTGRAGCTTAGCVARAIAVQYSTCMLSCCHRSCHCQDLRCCLVCSVGATSNTPGPRAVQLAAAAAAGSHAPTCLHLQLLPKCKRWQG